MKQVRKNITYVVRDRPVTLGVRIGQGQIGSTAVFRGKEELASAGVVLRVLLGEGSDLVRSTVRADSIVQDVLAPTNRMTVEYVLEGGAKREVFESRATVKEDELCRFLTTITFARAS